MSLNSNELYKMLETAIVSARLSGQHAMEEMNYLKVSVKNNSELVTQADSRCQKIIIDRIKEMYPDHGFIGEEGANGGIYKVNPRNSGEIWWVIDPIDGTNNFAHQIPVFCVSIAAFFEGKPVVAVIFDPSCDQMYTAVIKGDAQCNGRKISVNDEDITPFSSIGLDSHFDSGIPQWAQKCMMQTRFRNFGSAALQLAYVARGGLIATIEGYVKLWDIAAGVLIGEQAGAIITNFKKEPIFPVNLQKYDGEKMPVIAANPIVHTKICDYIGC